MSAIWNSYSKSLTARRPRTFTLAPASPREIDSSPSNARTSTRGSSLVSRANESDALLDGEQRHLADVARDRDDHAIGERARALDEVLVPVRDGVERTRVQGDALGRAWGRWSHESSLW